MTSKLQQTKTIQILLTSLFLFLLAPQAFALDPSITATMTTNTAPSGYVVGTGCVRSDHNSSSDAFKMFDGNNSNHFYTENNTECTYTIPAAKVLTAWGYIAGLNADEDPTAITIRGSNDCSTWTTLDTQVTLNSTQPTERDFTISNSTAYSCYGINVVTSGSLYGYGSLDEVFFYGTDAGGGGGGGGGSVSSSTLPSFIGMSAFDFIGTSTPSGSSTLWSGSYIINSTTQQLFDIATSHTQQNLFNGILILFLTFFFFNIFIKK